MNLITCRISVVRMRHERYFHSLSVRAETAGIDFCFEVDVVQDRALLEMHKQGSSVYKQRDVSFLQIVLNSKTHLHPPITALFHLAKER
jgi:hypothetical protein